MAGCDTKTFSAARVMFFSRSNVSSAINRLRSKRWNCMHSTEQIWSCILAGCTETYGGLRFGWSAVSLGVERKIRVGRLMRGAARLLRMVVLKPPFRADQVGSLLRPARLAAARAQFKQHAICADELRRIEDDLIRTLVQRQESIGLRSITDGELRRDYWHIDFLQELDGVGIVAMPNQNRFGGTEEQPPMATVTGKIGCKAPIMADAFAYLKSITAQTAKLTIPSPSMLYMRGGRNA